MPKIWGLSWRPLDPRYWPPGTRGDEETEQALAGSWRLRLQRLLETDPTLDSELRRLVEEYLTPALPGVERARVQQVIVNAEARGHARQYIAGRDQNITGA